jgi:hypothetical protein
MNFKIVRHPAARLTRSSRVLLGPGCSVLLASESNTRTSNRRSVLLVRLVLLVLLLLLLLLPLPPSLLLLLPSPLVLLPSPLLL